MLAAVLLCGIKCYKQSNATDIPLRYYIRSAPKNNKDVAETQTAIQLASE